MAPQLEDGGWSAGGTHSENAVPSLEEMWETTFVSELISYLPTQELKRSQRGWAAVENSENVPRGYPHTQPSLRRDPGTC